MKSMDSQLITIDDDVKNAQAVKGVILYALQEDGIISKEDADLYCMDYQIIIIKKSWWSNWKDIFGKDSSPGYFYKLLKVN